MMIRGIRGAITIKEDSPAEILTATTELLQEMQKANDFLPTDIASILFTVTTDIRAAFPAKAARELGWDLVPLLCFQEIEIKGALPYCIRVLIHINTNKSQEEIKHIYLRDAVKLRPDLKG